MELTSPTKIADLSFSDLKELQTLLSQLGLYQKTEVDGIFGFKTLKAWQLFKKSQSLGQIELIGPSSYSLLVEESKKQSNLITRQHFDSIFHYARLRDRDTYFLPINKALAEFEINNLRRMAAFLAQLSHESGNLRYAEEIASGSAYEGRRDLGNIYPGDGVRYKGRGLIQLTGRANYRTYGAKLGLDLIEDPTQAAQPLHAARIAGLYWQVNGLNRIADQNTEGAFRQITKRINGGYNGLEDRLKRWHKAKEVLGC